jgi:acyl-CoA thioester hydrolase
MTGVFSKSFDVPSDAIDANGHVNNIAYIQWMQDIAIDHSTAVGWPMARYFEAGFTWVARSHFIEYLRPAFAGEAISVHTWIGGMSARQSPRRYLFVRDEDRKLLAKAETMWVCVDTLKGRPIAVPEAMLAAFTIEADEAAVMKRLGL